MNFTSKAAVIDRLFAEYNLTRDNLIRLSFDSVGGVDLHIKGPLPGVEYTQRTAPPHVHHNALITREELDIRVVHITVEEVHLIVKESEVSA